jgi:hypothetical protein
MNRTSITALAVGIAMLARVASATAQDVSSRADEVQQSRYPGRALLETALFLVGNTVYYWWDKDFNAPDWEYGWNKESWRKKLITFEGVRLDANQFSTNAGSHTEAGTLVYLIGRGNGLGAGSSVLLTAGEVLVWEYLSEFREKVSLNDLLTNPLGGFAMGEPFFQLSDFFSRGSDNGINRTLALIFSPFSSVNDWADHQWPRRAGSVDGLGLPADVWHRFSLQVGLSNSRWTDDAERSETLLGLSTEINNVRGFGRPGSRAGGFGVGRITRLEGGLALANQGMTGALLATRVALAGYHAQSLHADGARLAGRSLTLALFNSFEYTNRRAPGLPLDQIASFGVAGPAVELIQRTGGVQARLRLEALPELAMITSMANPRFQESFGAEGLKSVLVQRGYYFGYGLNVGGELAIAYQPVEVSVASRWERFGSFEGIDRYQERVTNDYHLVDRRLSSMLRLTVRPLRGPALLSASLERATRAGTMLDVTTSTEERRAAVTLSLQF